MTRLFSSQCLVAVALNNKGDMEKLNYKQFSLLRTLVMSINDYIHDIENGELKADVYEDLFKIILSEMGCKKIGEEYSLEFPEFLKFKQ